MQAIPRRSESIEITRTCSAVFYFYSIITGIIHIIIIHI